MKKKLLIIAIAYSVLLLAFGVYYFFKGDSNYLGYKKAIQLAEKNVASKSKDTSLSVYSSSPQNASSNTSKGTITVDNKIQSGSATATGTNVNAVSPEKNTDPSAAKVEDYTNVTFTRTLQKGVHAGNDIKKLQYLLTRKGAYTKEINGNFDDATLEAVTKFQKSVNLLADGVAGAGTQKKLLE